MERHITSWNWHGETEMTRRLVLVLLACLLAVMVFEGSASATCVVTPMQQVIQTSDAVWWGEVTNATVATPYQSEGTWKLTIRLYDVLKGPGSQGSDETIIASGCGPPTTRTEQRQTAPSFVGEQRLFAGNIDKHGELVAFSQVWSPTGSPPNSSTT